MHRTFKLSQSVKGMKSGRGMLAFMVAYNLRRGLESNYAISVKGFRKTTKGLENKHITIV